MSKAYLIVHLNTDVFPPIVDRVMISSNTPGSMVDGPWAELCRTEGFDFQDAVEIMKTLLSSPAMSSYLPFVRRFLEMNRMEENRKQCLAAEAAIKMVEILNTPAVRL